jgi:hypothetical protein
MWFLVYLLLTNFVGLGAIFVAFTLWRNVPRNFAIWLTPRRQLGVFSLLAGGTGLEIGSQFNVIRWLPAWSPLPPEDLGFLSLGAMFLLAACLTVLGIGAGLLASDGQAARNWTAHPEGRVGCSLAAALLVTLTELSIFQHRGYAINYAKFTDYKKTAFIIAGLPAIKLTGHGTREGPFYKKEYRFNEKSKDYFTQHIPVWEKALQAYKGRPDVRYLEVGIFEGQSALWMLENVLTDPTARLTGLDPFSDPVYERIERSMNQTYKEVFYSNLRASGSEYKAQIIEGYSQVELRKLPLEYFDIVYIDGSHFSPDVLEDAIQSWRLLKEGGVLILDDYGLDVGMRRALETFFAFFGDHFELVHVDWQIFAKKKPAKRSLPDESG